jgi:hypothetical protein
MPSRFEDGRYSTRGLVEKFDVSYDVVKYWLRSGVITPDNDSTRAVHRYKLTPAVEARIAAALSRSDRAQRANSSTDRLKTSMAAH